MAKGSGRDSMGLRATSLVRHDTVMLSQAKKRLVRGLPAILAGGVAAHFSGRLTDSLALGTAFVVVGISTGGLLAWAAARLAGRKWGHEYVLGPVAGYCAAGVVTLRD